MVVIADLPAQSDFLWENPLLYQSESSCLPYRFLSYPDTSSRWRDGICRRLIHRLYPSHPPMECLRIFRSGGFCPPPRFYRNPGTSFRWKDGTHRFHPPIPELSPSLVSRYKPYLELSEFAPNHLHSSHRSDNRLHFGKMQM